MLFRSNDTATTEIYTQAYTLSLHDALPISIGAWLIALGVAAGQALAERDARRLRPAAVGYILLAALLAIALARYPHQYAWESRSGIAYLIFLASMLLTGTIGLARGLPRAALQSALRPAAKEITRSWQQS